MTGVITKKEDLKRITVLIPKEIKKRVARIAEKNERSVTWVIKAWITAGVREYEKYELEKMAERIEEGKN